MMKTPLTAAERLIVAFDESLEPSDGEFVVWQNALRFAGEVRGTGIVVKFNAPLSFYGSELVRELQALDLDVFMDLKLNDIPETLEKCGSFLRRVKPKFLTVMCSAGADALSRLKALLPETNVLGVTVLTSLDEDKCLEIYNRPVLEQCHVLAGIAKKAGLDGIVCSPAEAEEMRKVLGPDMYIVTPNIRSVSTPVKGDDQNPKRARTPAEAIGLGATHLVIGRPIMQALNKHEATLDFIRQIESAVG